MSNTNVEELVETLSGMTVLELAKLKDLLKETWNVEAAPAAVAVAAAPGAGAAAEAEEEATDFAIVLDSCDASKKIAVIKVVRAVTGLGLKEAKEAVEGTPSTLKESCPKAEAEDFKKQLEEAGAKVTLKAV